MVKNQLKIFEGGVFHNIRRVTRKNWESTNLWVQTIELNFINNNSCNNGKEIFIISHHISGRLGGKGDVTLPSYGKFNNL